MDTLSTNQKVLISALVGFVIGAGSVLVWNISRGGDGAPEVAMGSDTETREHMDDTTAVDTDTQVAAPVVTVVATGDMLQVEDQEAGMFVDVAMLKLDTAGWVAVHEDVNGNLGNVLGAAWFPRGTSQGTVELLRATVPGATYHVVLYGDNDNKVFELNVDPQLADEAGMLIMDSFMTLE